MQGKSLTRRLVAGTTKRVLLAMIYAIFGMVVVVLVLLVRHLQARPDLEVWHSAELDEFTVDSGLGSFAEYLALEEELFQQVEERVYALVPDEERQHLNRFFHGSATDPNAWDTNWNRSFELTQESPHFGVLLLHGMSDSPYSLRSIGKLLHDEGAYVVGMRVPGHGTAPVGLVDVTWEDMAAATKLAARHVRDTVGDAPLYLVGYSNGGALAIHHALAAIEDDTLAKTDGLILFSPEVGITKLAAYAIWLERLGHVLGLEKLAWSSILPEYDPYKYQSFALNAGVQAYRITCAIQLALERLASRLGELPRILAFQSVVDATVTAETLVTALFDPLPGGDHELVLFDLNRFSGMEELLSTKDRESMERVLRASQRRFTTTVLTNRSEGDAEVVATTWRAGAKAGETVDLGVAWPHGIYSLSHLALPFRRDDPLYGPDGRATGENPGMHQGDLAPRGEREVLQVPAADLLRMRWNPFRDYVDERVLAFVGGSGD